eukprot:m.52461 g.52461  ORF g.52461 m.52461 type:complete len:126 (-) comp9103_c0_seq3:848-1225(-)
MAAARCLSKQVTVVSYNVLAPTLCSVDRFVTSNPKNLDPEARFKKVLRKLEPHVEQGAIICLQEVSMTWGGLLHTWFHQRRYGLTAFGIRDEVSEHVRIEQVHIHPNILFVCVLRLHGCGLSLPN